MIEVLEDEKKRWNDFVYSSDQCNCYHLAGWREIIQRACGHKCYYLSSEDGNEINGILPLVLMKSVFFGKYLISMPFFNYGGMAAYRADVRKSLMDKAIDLAQTHKADFIELRTTTPMDGFMSKMAKVSMRLRLPTGFETLRNSFPSKLRSQIKRPTREGMYSKIGREKELDGFYKVFSQNMRDLGTPVYPKNFFKQILLQFPERTWICTVYSRGDEPVASGFLVGFKDTLEIPWASSLREYNSHSPNMLLYSSVLQFACENGYEVFDFGRSTPGEGTYKFKEQWGAKPLQLHWHYWLSNGGKLPELNPRNPKYRAVIAAWKKLPLWFTNLVGPKIVRNIP